jgi:hypothetical protein
MLYDASSRDTQWLLLGAGRIYCTSLVSQETAADDDDGYQLTTFFALIFPR